MNPLSCFFCFVFVSCINFKKTERNGRLTQANIRDSHFKGFIVYQIPGVNHLVVFPTSLVFHGHCDTVVGNSCLWSMLAPLLTLVGHERMLLSAVLYISLYYVTP